ncbi:ABC-three component system middle component 6 [Planococcus maritimus]|uniref:ABC-three component system middle component 6 n=1 Tax=Planococcus maritimus TaxID=192421 RepID=UPI000791D4B7|nr:ABC-three component system middle component 6 [Planococcus maritimus]KYG58818.1 hypothetical protein AY633_00825 [Planococcus maritimus]
MLLIDRDSKPEETIFYLSARLLLEIKKKEKINVVFIDSLYEEVDSKQPAYKHNLSLNFLFLINKIKIENGDLVYVP